MQQVEYETVWNGVVRRESVPPPPQAHMCVVILPVAKPVTRQARIRRRLAKVLTRGPMTMADLLTATRIAEQPLNNALTQMRRTGEVVIAGYRPRPVGQVRGRKFAAVYALAR